MRIRAARRSVKRAVREFVSRIWDGDYVLDVFDDWVRDRRGRLWVAVEDGRPIGIAKPTLLGDHEGWLHARRVDPRYQRRGIGGALFTYRVARARHLGARVARFDTTRVAMRKIARRHRFRIRERYEFFALPARRGVAPRLARPAEIDRLWRLEKDSDGLFHGEFTMRTFTRDDLARAIRRRLCVVADEAAHPAGFAVLIPADGRLGVSHIAGTGRPLVALLRSLSAEAAKRKARRVAMKVPRRLRRAVRTAGYGLRDEEVQDVFEGRL